jgi:hypothetical protein
LLASDNVKKTVGMVCICAFLFGTFLSFSARAVSTSTDYSALWWNASESGWGMNVMQEEQILFITLFIYGPNAAPGSNGAPTWYSASATFASANGAGDRTYTGDLYATTGTPFSTTPFDSGATTAQKVGSIQFVGRADGTATVQYTAGSATVNKTVVRQTWAQPNFTLNTATAYVGASSEVNTGCANASDNGPGNTTYSQIGLYINSVGNTMHLELTMPPTEGGLCTFHGNNYVQEGRYGKATLTGRCAAMPASAPGFTIQAREVEVGANYFTMQYSVTSGPNAGCTSVGVLTGAKK